MSWLLVALSIVSNAAASALVKSTSLSIVGKNRLAVLTEPRLFIALVCYGCAFVSYAAAVARMPLNVAHPTITAGALIMVGLASAFIFREHFSPGSIAGYAFLLAGIVVLGLTQP
jgi:small multidrug resistance pump